MDIAAYIYFVFSRSQKVPYIFTTPYITLKLTKCLICLLSISKCINK